MQKENEKFNVSDIMEGMSSISAVIKSIKSNTTNRKIISVFIDKEKKQSKKKEIAFLTHQSKDLNFSISFVDSSAISEFTTGGSHGGIIAFCTPRALPCLSASNIKKDGIFFMLDGVEDPYNFGYSVRSIYASGADGIIVPPRNWLGAAGVVARSSAGTSELMNIQISEPLDAIKMFKQLNYTVVCAGIRDSESLFEIPLKKPLLVILGGEKRGISRDILDMADKTVRIDYGTDFNGSLSTAASAAIFSFEIYRQNRN